VEIFRERTRPSTTAVGHGPGPAARIRRRSYIVGKQAFRELITPFLSEKLRGLEVVHGADSPEYQALAHQYVRSQHEDEVTPEANLRHYEADVAAGQNGHAIPGIERLYRRTLVIEPTLACAAHCRYCIRANYPRHNLSEEQLAETARFCGSAANRNDLSEVLITGGDVLLIPQRVDFLLRSLIQYAPNIRVARIATRIPVQDPRRINAELLRIFEDKSPLRIELATQINHRVELFPEVVEAYQRIMDRGVRVYAQNVMLRGVNDSLETLIELYDGLRELGIESHYLFHCVPLKGMAHLRTTLRESVDLARGLSSCGSISGRAKPILAAMTDIGKIVLYEGTILQEKKQHVLLQSSYRMEERRRWNPNWKLPETAEVDENGMLRVWYMDGQAESDVLSDRDLEREDAEAATGLRLPVLRSLVKA
jgi:lysine 2,3-aminomutase